MEYSGRGINYRALDDLFAINEERQGEVCTGLLSSPQALRTHLHGDVLMGKTTIFTYSTVPHI